MSAHALVRAAWLAAFAATLLAAPVAGLAQAPALKEMLGVYLGRATVKEHDTGATEERDIDVEVTPFERNGFRIRWVNVTLVDGKRNVAGVKRRVAELAFRPAKGGKFFVEAPAVNLFAEREESQPMGGDPVRWAVLDAGGLHVYAFFVLDDGRYELQTYTRRRAGTGIELHYERLVDGKLQRSIDGRAVKVE